MSSRPKKPAASAAPKAPSKSSSGRRGAAVAVLALAGIIAVGAIGYAVWSYRAVEPEVASAPEPGSAAPDGAATPSARVEPGLVTKVESLYNDIYLYRQPDGNFMLSFGAERLRYIESIVNPNDEMELPVEYTQSMVAAALAYPERLDSALLIGLGGGRTAWYIHKSVPDLDFTAVELDPEVAKIADRYFNVAPEENFSVEIRDGRVWLTRTEQKFDVILIDAYRGPFVPFHLLTTEFYQLVAEHLNPGGVAVQNVEPTTMLFDSAVATIKAAFEHTVFLSGAGNIVIVAYNGPEKSREEIRRIAAERQAQYGFRYPLETLLDRQFDPEWDTATKALTDDFAPVEYLKAIDRHNEKQT